jgi:hypothetical protein
MSLVLAIPISMIFLIGGMKLNISPDHLVIVLAIIFAGGLAGCKD